MKFKHAILSATFAGTLSISAQAVELRSGANSNLTTIGQSTTQRDSVPAVNEVPSYLQWTNEDLRQSKAWGMKQSEWMEYKELMSTGPNAAYYANKPELTPPMVMGINAKTDYDRTRYAKLSVEMERARLAREVQFDEAVNQYIKTLIPNHPVWMSDLERRAWAKRNAESGVDSAKAAGLSNNSVAVPIKDTRTVAYADAENCDVRCTGFIKNLATRSSKLNRLDLFVINARSDENLLSFSRAVGISTQMLADGKATVNYDSGYYARLKPAPGLPVAYRVQLNNTVELKP
ncbi:MULTISPECIES: hypothetical protein [Aeromonas]|uniref:Integrating conjugative element protein n=1 Tax=Aeromonas caviae TaxID=648 RepID=A0AA42VGU7_AERCA|nr:MULTISPECIES: hypothetical protein [Aeromonas]HEB5079049.1 hypothetical protein [Aeromonas hydrophila subsp. hydrophila]MBP4059146.1 hypothetical protein [Aeromonas sp. Prich7-2]MCW4617946.1 hypothetical protein [Aeromonas hydrophila]MDH0309493.1 hypothetical protein [Aeromonas caviae]MDH0319948.1 hypothetical protein [Aeromonas caviae]